MTIPPKFSLEQFDIKPFSSQLDLSDFNCDFEEEDLGLNEFIHKEAMDYQHDCMGSTYIFFNQNIPMGFVTIAMYAIEVKETKLRMVTSEKRYPALLLGRLGVDNNYRNRHVGRCIVQWTVAHAKALAKEVGCRFVVVLTRQSKVVFYERCGFEVCPKYDNKKKVLMNFQIA
jgi:GNAT superfamily N-acetyltransferase